MILLVAGTRPEIIKLMPVYRALKRTQQDVRWLWTNQQPDLVNTFSAFDVIPELGLNMTRESGTLMELNCLLTSGFEYAYEKHEPEMVVVQGDTMSAAVGAQQAFLHGIGTAHVEAGLRSWNPQSPYPEEACRVWIDAVADLKFAPTDQAAMTLSGNVYVVGNTAIDALRYVKPKTLRPGLYGVVTMHRRENADGVRNVCAAVRRILASKALDRIVWPLHPNPIVSKIVPDELDGVAGVELIQPCRYDQMVNLLRGSRLVMTDSGGIQEECLALNVPCLVMREETERPEGVQAGGAMLVGTDTAKIANWAQWLMENPGEWAEMANAPNPYGDGNAGKRIATVVTAALAGRRIDPEKVAWTGV